MIPRDHVLPEGQAAASSSTGAWNHNFAAHHHIGLTLYKRRRMYPTRAEAMPGGIEETVRNLRERLATV